MEIETTFLESNNHMGIKISGARRLVGITQQELADRLGITKQAISKMEQTENIDDERLGKVAIALGVSLQGIKKFNTENVLYYTNNFYENCGVSATNGAMLATGRIENVNHFSMEQAMKFFEELLRIEKEKYEKASSAGNKKPKS